MIDFTSLVRELGRRGPFDWTVIERRSEIASIDEGVQRHEQRTRLALIVHDDTSDGRGSARIELGAFDDAPDRAVDQAQRLARAAIGPIWISGPPAAPAKVAMIDKAIEKADLVDAARSLLRDLKRPHARVEIARTEVSVRTSRGLRSTWIEGVYRAGATIAAGERSIDVERTERSRELLGLDAAFGDAMTDLSHLASAAAPISGPCALILNADAMLDGGYGVWAPFVAQADAIRTREGLARYRVDMAIAPNADQIPEPLSIASDGALDLGLRSSPLDDEGDAIRRFPIIDRGIAVGLGMRAKDAAFLKSEPNGGVRNLVVSTGTWDEAALPGVRTIEVRRLRDLAIDPYTGEASLEIELALEAGAPITGGTIRLDLIAALAHARRSAVPTRRGAYEGPRAVLIERVDLS